MKIGLSRKRGLELELSAEEASLAGMAVFEWLKSRRAARPVSSPSVVDSTARDAPIGPSSIGRSYGNAAGPAPALPNGARRGKVRRSPRKAQPIDVEAQLLDVHELVRDPLP